ncbi:MAG: magnesium transporter [Verrucomicrobiales bacterium]|nr:magnesium transporter [Verrucomicrobiales bacterium]
MPETTALLPLVQKFFERDLVGAARSLETMPEEQVVEVLRALPAALAARAVRQLQVSYAAAVLKDAEVDLFQQIAAGLDSHHAATIFMHLPREARERFLAHLPEKLKRDIQEQLTYPEDSVGRMMSTDFLSFRTDATVADAVHAIRQLVPKRYPASYAYVVDEQDRLRGVLNMRDLLLAAPESTLSAIMRTDLFTLHCFTDREDAADQLSKRRYFAAPVVDHEGRVLGIIKAEQLLQGVQEEVSEDLQRMFGAGGDERSFSPIGYSLRKRLPWLHVNLATAFLAAGVVALFESTIAKITVLAVFLPVVAGQGGNAGAQSLAVVMRGLVMREIPKDKIRRLVLKEGWLGMISGWVTGIVTALVAWAWHGNPWLGLVIGLAMIVNLFAAGLSGAAIPVVMKTVGLDPAQCSSIILTTVTDVIGFFAFLGFAVLFQSHLL